MSFAFMTVLGAFYLDIHLAKVLNLYFAEAKSQQSYQELLNNIRDILKSKYSQKPQLSSSHPMVCLDLACSQF